MDPIEINYPVYTVDREILLASGTLVSEALLDELIAGAPQPPSAPQPLLSHARVRNDIHDLFGNPSYRIVFSDKRRNERIMELLGKVELVDPVLASLDYFRRNDRYTYRHILLVMMLSALLARELLENTAEQQMGTMAGPMHDIGKTSIPLAILQKKQPLNEAEYRYLKHHAIAGYVLLAYYLRDPRCLAARVARDHHERRNGTGYPRGIALRDPMIEIIMACDVFDALISPRPYRPQSFDTRTALEELTGMAAEGALDRDVVRALVSFNRKSHPHYRDCHFSHEKRGTPPPGNLYAVRADRTGPSENDN
ncbi:MAG: HD domain-containing protein [Desulfobacterales bacterium]|jgi:HD-GYP domain-containing protein (c-di-GMP phosphodiesterase class II)